jgi:uncharacterized protein
MTSVVTHFEIYGDNPGKLAEFYQSLFGWHTEKAAGVDYWRIRPNAAQTRPIGGGLTYRSIPQLRGWLNYITVPSIDVVLAQAVHLGGTIVRAKTAVPKVAWYALLADPDGNVFAVSQADPTAFPSLDPDS